MENPETNPEVAGPEADEFDAFLDNVEDHEELFDPNQVVSIRSSSGGSFEVPVDEPLSIQDLLDKGGLLTAGQMEYWVDGTAVPVDHLVGPGATVYAVGVVKGGR